MHTLATGVPRNRWLRMAQGAGLVAMAVAAGCGGDSGSPSASADGAPAAGGPTPSNGPALAAQGRQIFRLETFGNEAFWTDKLRMHEVIPALDPTAALAAGLKVDADALPAAVADGIRNGSVDLTAPATTLALLKLDAIVGVKGVVQTVNGQDRLTRFGVTCALCHSTVDNSFAPGIGKRLDGWPNRDLNPGAIIALSPALDGATKAVYSSWGKGKYDARFNIDGRNNPTVIPPAYGLQDIHRITFTGDGEEIAYWNRYVAVTQMGGLGTMAEPRLNLAVTNGTVDLVTDKLPALQAYQLTLQPPPAPAGGFDIAAASRGKAIFEGAGKCATCHTGSTFTDANSRLHPPAASMAEPETDSHAARSATKQYRTTPLRGMWQHAPYFHDGSAATADQAVETYNNRLGLGLSAQDVADVAHYLRSL